VLPGHLFQFQFIRPAGSPEDGRPEGSILCTLMIVIVGVDSAACLRQVKYPDAAASRNSLPHDEPRASLQRDSGGTRLFAR